MKRTILLTLVSIVLSMSSDHSAQELLVDHFVWPISASDQPDYPLNSTFGPRQKLSENGRYDFHRGIDIHVPMETVVYAIADGEIFRAGDYPHYSDRIVVIRHEIDGQRYHTYYAHLHSVMVKEGDLVKRGQPVALSGKSESGFPHLHMEIRRGSNYQKNALHPLAFLDYPDHGGPDVTIESLDRSDPENTSAQVYVELPLDQLDLVRVEIILMSAADDREIARHTFDMEAWNQEFDRKSLDQASFNGVVVDPARFNRKSETYRIDFDFNQLNTSDFEDDIKAKAIATDARGNQTTTHFPAVEKAEPAREPQ
ncbi:MAG: M23 family metallopeptidase [Planctomycetota bacterium]